MPGESRCSADGYRKIYFTSSRIRRATIPVTLCPSPNATPRSLKRRSISHIVSSPIPTSWSRVCNPSERKNRSVASMVRVARSSSLPSVIPHTRSPYWSIFAIFWSRSTFSRPGKTMASVCPCVRPLMAVSSCPIWCVAQSSVTPMAINPLSPMVAHSM